MFSYGCYIKVQIKATCLELFCTANFVTFRLLTLQHVVFLWVELYIHFRRKCAHSYIWIHMDMGLTQATGPPICVLLEKMKASQLEKRFSFRSGPLFVSNRWKAITRFRLEILNVGICICYTCQLHGGKILLCSGATKKASIVVIMGKEAWLN